MQNTFNILVRDGLDRKRVGLYNTTRKKKIARMYIYRQVEVAIFYYAHRVENHTSNYNKDAATCRINEISTITRVLYTYMYYTYE